MCDALNVVCATRFLGAFETMHPMGLYQMSLRSNVVQSVVYLFTTDNLTESNKLSVGASRALMVMGGDGAALSYKNASTAISVVTSFRYFGAFKLCYGVAAHRKFEGKRRENLFKIERDESGNCKFGIRVNSRASFF